MANNDQTKIKQDNGSEKMKFGVSLALLAGATGILGITFILLNIFRTNVFVFWKALAVLGILWAEFMIVYFIIIQLRKTKQEKFEEVNRTKQIHIAISNKKLLNRLLVGALLLLELIILSGILAIIFSGKWDTIYDIVALALILIWFGILIGYYAWAIYFYNINLGLTNHDWAEIREKSQHLPEGAMDIPSDNPNEDQTLGLPPGTVRGSIALTLLVGGLAMAIAALGMKSILKEDSFIVDHFDFFKTAFLMMIAFYFGNKSLEMIGYRSSTSANSDKKPNTPSDVNSNSTSGTEAPVSPVTASASQLKNKLLTEDDSDSTDNDQDDFNNPNAVQ